MLGHRDRPPAGPGKGLDKLDHRGVASSRLALRASGGSRVRSMHWRGSREPHITIRTGGSHRRGTIRPPVLQPCWWASSMESIPTPAHVRRSPVAGRCVHVSAFPESGQCVRANVQGGPFWAVLDRLLVCASSGRDSASLRRTLVAVSGALSTDLPERAPRLAAGEYNYLQRCGAGGRVRQPTTGAGCCACVRPQHPRAARPPARYAWVGPALRVVLRRSCCSSRAAPRRARRPSPRSRRAVPVSRRRHRSRAPRRRRPPPAATRAPRPRQRCSALPIFMDARNKSLNDP